MYKALIENLLNYSGDTKIQLRTVEFSGESGNFAQTSPTTTPFNHGLRSRSEWFKDTYCVEFIGPLLDDILIKID